MVMTVLGLLLVSASALALYFGYSSQDILLSGLAWAGLLIGAVLSMVGFARSRTPRIYASDLAPEEADRRHVEIRALVQSMGVMALADKKIRNEEVATIASIHEQILGLAITHEEVYEILDEFVPGFNITRSLTEKRGLISPAMKRKIVQCCHLVSVSDLEIAEPEAGKLMEVGLALGYDEDEIRDIIAEVSV